MVFIVKYDVTSRKVVSSAANRAERRVLSGRLASECPSSSLALKPDLACSGHINARIETHRAGCLQFDSDRSPVGVAERPWLQLRLLFASCGYCTGGRAEAMTVQHLNTLLEKTSSYDKVCSHPTESRTPPWTSE